MEHNPIHMSVVVASQYIRYEVYTVKLVFMALSVVFF